MSSINNATRASFCPQAVPPWILLAAITAAWLLAGCGKGSGAAGEGSVAPPPIPVHVVTVEPKSVPVTFDVVGQVEGSKQVEVRARVSGILQKQFYREGDTVKDGAPLFEIDRAPFEVSLAQAKGQRAQATAQRDQAKREEARLKPLVEERAVSRKEYDDATSALQLSEAAVEQAGAAVHQAELNLSYTTATAPVSGISGRAEHSIGTLITTDANGSLLTTINVLTPIWVRFSLAQSDLAKLPGGHVARGALPEIQLLLPDGTPYPRKGRLNFAATAIDLRLGTQQLRAEFDNPQEQLLPGQFVTVRITAGQRTNVFLVPQSAVIQTEKANLVFVADADGKVEARTVTTGDWIGSDWSIVAGLKTGDKVIIDNLLRIRPGVAVTEPTPSAEPASEPAK